ncbi:MAG TPA: prolipoprotein diacylglyceryl transferase [Ignavibacteriaceae bacterium]|nr:prolipoprotein diacylglyceryl transferase [Ignavibacteriaceae bacterium]
MYPELFKIGPFTVYSYGLMLGIAFIIASYILTKEFERKKLNPNLATEITLLAIIFGIIGSKLFSLFENWSEFLQDPVGMAFSPGGLTFYGGLILATLAIWIYVRRKKIPFLVIADGTSPSLILAYGIGRIGCHLAGDGDYGIPTSLPWGTDYSHGTVPPSVMFRGTDIAKHFPNGIVPDNTPLHPTPIYEFLAALIIFYILWQLRKKDWSDGKLFMAYLVFAGIERFLVEIIRLNPRLLFGLSEAQLISIVMIILGTTGFIYLSKRNKPKFIPLSIKQDKKKKPLREAST